MDSVSHNLAKLGVEKDYVGRVPQMQDSNEFAVTVPPEFKDNARILGICGTPMSLASPKTDGWFLSDFFLFMHLFRGLGSSQKWLANMSPEALVSKYGEYLHGNPYGERRVVLDADVLKKKELDPVTVMEESSMKRAFLEHLREQALIAKKNSQPLLVCIFGHGTAADEHGVVLGTFAEDSVLRMDEFVSAIPEGVDVTLFTNACYSAGWCCNRNMKKTAFNAAGPATESESCAKIHSMSRHCGSTWASMIVQALKEEVQQSAEAAHISQEPLPKEAQQRSFAAFVEACYTILLQRVGRLEIKHQICFSVQEAGWGGSWTERSGVPLARMGQWFSTLKTRDPIQNSKSTSNGNTIAKREIFEPESSRAWLASLANQNVDLVARDIASRFGSIQAGRSFVLAHCVRYQLSYPGRDSLSSNTALHGQIQQLKSGDDVDWEFLSQVLRMVEYRLSATSVATSILGVVNVKLPEGKKCSQWDPDTHRPHELSKNAELIYDTAGKLIRARKIFPSTVGTKQGFQFMKPERYLSAALMDWVLQGNKTQNGLEEKVQEMVDVIEAVVEEQKAHIRCLEPIRSRKREWAASIGKGWRSPEKGQQ